MIEWDKYPRYNEKGKKLRYFKRHPDKLQELYVLKKKGWTNIQLARRYGVHHSTISSQWKKYLGLGKTMSGEYVTIQRVIVVKKVTCLVPDEGPRNPGKDYKDYLRFEREKKYKRLLQKGGMKI